MFYLLSFKNTWFSMSAEKIYTLSSGCENSLLVSNPCSCIILHSEAQTSASKEQGYNSDRTGTLTLRGRWEQWEERGSYVSSLQQRRSEEYSHSSGGWWKLTTKLISVISGCLTICSIKTCTHINHYSTDTGPEDVSDRLPIIIIWLGDISLTFCPENARRGNLMCPESMGYVLWGVWMRLGNDTAILPMLIFPLNMWLLCAEVGTRAKWGRSARVEFNSICNPQC